MSTRRTFLTEPGEPLAVSPSPVESAIRFGRCVEFFGGDESDVLLSPMSSVPLPIYPLVRPEGQRRWANTRPEAMWHPLMWLPPHVAGRYSMTDAEGKVLAESDELWAVRVGYELSATGLYDEDTATWTDILSLVDIDIATAAGVDRVQAWLDGSDDHALDMIDLTPMFTEVARINGGDDWAIELACHEMDSLRVIAWACSAESLLDHCEDIAEEESDDLDGLRRGAGLLAAMAGIAFAKHDSHPDGADNEADWWVTLSERIEAFDGSASDLTQGPIEAMVGRLMELREEYWPQLMEMSQPA